jgi:hypothetical protein
MIDDQTLDALLTASRPEVEHDPSCASCARVPAPQRRRGRWVAAAGVAGVAVLAVGAGAAATVGLPFVDPSAAVKHSQVTSDGHTCTYSMTVSADESPDVTADPAALAAARGALATVDPDSLDISTELAGVLAANDAFVWDGPGTRPDFFYAVDSRSLSEHQALTQAISREVFSEVEAQGLSTKGLKMSSEGQCDDFEPSMAQP